MIIILTHKPIHQNSYYYSWNLGKMHSRHHSKYCCVCLAFRQVFLPAIAIRVGRNSRGHSKIRRADKQLVAPTTTSGRNPSPSAIVFHSLFVFGRSETTKDNRVSLVFQSTLVTTTTVIAVPIDDLLPSKSEAMNGFFFCGSWFLRGAFRKIAVVLFASLKIRSNW